MSGSHSDDEPPAPPPPPHGVDPKTTSGTLPPGNYDIFIVPPHSSGSGFLYLPSLKPQINSFVAGYATALLTCGICAIFYSKALLVYDHISGNSLAVLLALTAGIGGWTFGRSQNGGLPFIWTSSSDKGNKPSAGKKEQPKSNSTSSSPLFTPPPPPHTSPKRTYTSSREVPDSSRKSATAPCYEPKTSSGLDQEQSSYNPSQDKAKSRYPDRSTDGAIPPPIETQPHEREPIHKSTQKEPFVPTAPVPESFQKESCSAPDKVPSAPAPNPIDHQHNKRDPLPNMNSKHHASVSGYGDEPTVQNCNYENEARWSTRKPKPEVRTEAQRGCTNNSPVSGTCRQPSGYMHSLSRRNHSKSRPYASTQHERYNPRPISEKGLSDGTSTRETPTRSSGPNLEGECAKTRVSEACPMYSSSAFPRSSSPTPVPDTKKISPESEPVPNNTPRPTPQTKTPCPETTDPHPADEARTDESITEAERKAAATARFREALNATKAKREAVKAAEESKRKREENEAKLKEMRARDARERTEREAKENETVKKGSAYAYSATGEKIAPWPRGRPTTPPPQARTSPIKSPPAPRAETYKGTDEDSFSYGPYDRPKHKKGSSSDYSESSYASQSTSKTTPPPSQHGPYRTKDPDKIVLKAVYMFDQANGKTPVAQLISGLNNMSDGMILRIDTAGLWIDDDVRNEGHREWDIKAWTLGSLEVWCSLHVTSSRFARFTHSTTLPFS